MKLDLEPEGRLSEGIEVLSKQIDKVEHGQNQLKARLERMGQEMDQFREENRKTLALILNRLSGN